MSDDWLHSDDDSSKNKRLFLMQHGAMDDVRKIIGASKHHLQESSRIDLVMAHNPHNTPPEAFEKGWEKHPALRWKIAMHPYTPKHIHEQALKFDNEDVQLAALRNPQTTLDQIADRRQSRYAKVSQTAERMYQAMYQARKAK
jgi:hypothetical protein